MWVCSAGMREVTIIYLLRGSNNSVGRNWRSSNNSCCCSNNSSRLQKRINYEWKCRTLFSAVSRKESSWYSEKPRKLCTRTGRLVICWIAHWRTSYRRSCSSGISTHLKTKFWILRKYSSNLRNLFRSLSSLRCEGCLLILKSTRKSWFASSITLEIRQITALEVATRVTTKQMRSQKQHPLQHRQVLEFRSRISWITIRFWK